jgi:hypothetical protein
MHPKVFDAFFDIERVEAGSNNHKHTPKRDSTRSLSKGNWSTYYVVCKRCGKTICPSNGFPVEEMLEWPGMEQHILDYHEEGEIIYILLS